MSRPSLAPIPRTVAQRLDDVPADQWAAWSRLWSILLRPTAPSDRTTPAVEPPMSTGRSNRT